MRKITYTIDDLIAAHWGDTLVLQGETPEEYAIRRQEERMVWVGLSQDRTVWVRVGRLWVEFLRTEGD